MGRSVETELPQARYSYGGDEYVFVELAEAMSLKVNFRAMAITNRLREEDIPGVTDICPSNASYMIRIDPDELHPDDLISRLKDDRRGGRRRPRLRAQDPGRGRAGDDGGPLDPRDPDALPRQAPGP